jgi:hypothetical protein
MLNANYFKYSKLILVFFLILIYFSCFPGGWSPDSISSYLFASSDRYNPNKPLLLKLIFQQIIFFFNSFDYYIYFHFQTILYILGIYKLSTLLKKNIVSHFFLIFFIFFPPFLGIALAFWGMSIALPFLIFSLYYLMLKIFYYKKNNFLFLINLIIFIFLRWENIIIGGILIFLYFSSAKEFENILKNKKIFLKKFILSSLTIIFIFFLNIYSHNLLTKKNYLIDNEKRKNTFLKPVYLLHLGGKLEQDLIPKKFLTDKIANLTIEKRIDKYKKYYRGYKTKRKRKFFKKNMLNTSDFQNYYQLINKKHMSEFIQIKKRLQYANFTQRANTLYPMVVRKKFKDKRLLDMRYLSYGSTNIKKYINRYLKIYKSSKLNFIMIYYLLSIISALIFLYKSFFSKIKENKLVYFSFFGLTIIPFLTVNLLLFFGLLLLEFRYITLSLICLFVPLFFYYDRELELRI